MDTVKFTVAVAHRQVLTLFQYWRCGKAWWSPLSREATAKPLEQGKSDLPRKRDLGLGRDRIIEATALSSPKRLCGLESELSSNCRGCHCT